MKNIREVEQAIAILRASRQRAKDDAPRCEMTDPARCNNSRCRRRRAKGRTMCRACLLSMGASVKNYQARKKRVEGEQ